MASDMQPIVVPSFGGGLNFTKHPAELDPSEWSWSDGWLAKDGYAEVLPGYTRFFGPGGLTNNPVVTGLLQNPFGWENPQRPFLVAAVNTTTNSNVRLWKLSPSGSIDEITWDASGTQPSGDAFNCVTQGAFLNGFLALNFGIGPTAVSMIRWGSGANYGGLSQAPKAYHLATHAAHLVAAVTAFTPAGIRSLAISDANNESVWTPAISNSADTTVLDDLESAITGLGLIGDNLGIFTRGTIFQLTSTGAIPPFTRHVALRRGALDRFSGDDAWFPRGPLLGSTPLGTVFRGSDDFYVAETNQGVGKKVYDYWRFKDESATVFSAPPQFQWHQTRGVLYVPVAAPDSGAAEMLLFDPQTGAWSRRTFAASVFPHRHACLWDDEVGGTVKPRHRHLFATTDPIEVYIETAAGTPAGGEFVDTKDFRLPDPLVEAELFKIKLDWEPLTNASTDAIEVLAFWRTDFAPSGFLGSAGKHLDLSANMVSQGTLTGGASELDVRGSGKLCRLRFRRSSGRMRIRGFSMHYAGDGSDRKAA